MKQICKKKKTENELFFYVALTGNEFSCTGNNGCSGQFTQTNGQITTSSPPESIPMSSSGTCKPGN